MGVPSNLGRFSVKTQSGGWGSAESSFANANFLECSVSIPTPAQEAISAEVMRADWFATTRLAGGKGPTEITLTMPLHGFSTASPSGDPTEHPDALLMRSVLGSGSADGYHASDLSGGTASAIELTDGTGSVDDVGHALLVPISGGHSVGWLQDYDGSATPDVYNVIRPLSAAPSASGAIYGSQVAVLDKTQPDPFTLQFLGSTANTGLLFSDCVVTSATITLNAREQPTLECTIRAGGWTNGETGAPSAAALANRPQLPVVLGDNGARVIDGSSAAACGQVSIAMTSEVADEVNFSGQGISRFVVTRRTVEVTAVTPATSGTPTAGNLDNPATLLAPGQATGALQIDANTTPGRAFSALLASGQIRELQSLGDSGGIVAITTTIEPALYTSDVTDTGSVSSPGNTPFRLAWM